MGGGLKVPGGKAKRQPQKIKLGVKEAVGGETEEEGQDAIIGPCQEIGGKM